MKKDDRSKVVMLTLGITEMLIKAGDVGKSVTIQDIADELNVCDRTVVSCLEPIDEYLNRKKFVRFRSRMRSIEHGGDTGYWIS